MIQELDKTDPSHRLVAHNKRASSPNRYTTKLSTSRCLFCVLSTAKLIPIRGAASEHSENVLDTNNNNNDVDDTSTTQDGNFDDMYPSMASSSILPKETVTEGIDTTSDNDTATTDDGRPHRLRATNGRNGPGSAMLASGPAESNPSGYSANKRQLRTQQGVKVPAISDKTWKEVQQLCNIECGPNLVQRIENGARGIGTFKPFEDLRSVYTGDLIKFFS